MRVPVPAVPVPAVPALPVPLPVPVPVRSLPPSSLPVDWLDPDRLDVYRLALDFQALAARLGRARGIGALRDQLDRASCSIVLNIAEGAGRSAPLEAHFYSIARGSATESAAALDLLLARGLVASADHRRARSLLVRIVSMLVGLMRRFARADAGSRPGRGV